VVKIGILTSSRADFGVYQPLLRALKNDAEISFDIIAFGTHLSKSHGETITEILEQGFDVKYKIPCLLISDTEESIATNVALTFLKFSSFWENVKKVYDIIICMGDRYEMFAAVLAGVPFGIKFAHFYGGDQTKGAVDNVYRDCITMASKIHFTSTEKCAARVNELQHSNSNIYVVGILSLEDSQRKLISVEEFKLTWGVDLGIPTVLITFHPETVNAENNYHHVQIVKSVLEFLVRDFQLVITMPNADTNASVYRNFYDDLKKQFSDRVFLFENLGTTAYFSCLKYSRFVIGNTSSGISEAPSFNKYYINVGDRQKGRETGGNVLSVPFQVTKILDAVSQLKNNYEFNGANIYFKEKSIDRIVNTLKTLTVE
jgi:GDP/UDP-N,N'-diacetylbacillosamine 2-epimerase (hydrolysing)